MALITFNWSRLTWPAVGITPSGAVVAEDIRDLQSRTRRAGAICDRLFDLRLRLPGSPMCTFGNDSASSGLSIAAIMPVATRV